MPGNADPPYLLKNSGANMALLTSGRPGRPSSWKIQNQSNRKIKFIALEKNVYTKRNILSTCISWSFKILTVIGSCSFWAASIFDEKPWAERSNDWIAFIRYRKVMLWDSNNWKKFFQHFKRIWKTQIPTQLKTSDAIY